MRSRLPSALFGAAVVSLLARAPRAAPSDASTPTCRKLDLATKTKLETEAIARYRPSYKGCRLDVAFDACVPDGAVSSLVWESGYGHTFQTTITITSLVRDESDVWSVTRIELQRGRGSGAAWADAKPDGARVQRGTIASAQIDRAVDHARDLATATMVERPPENSFGGGGWMSSCDFHDAISFVAGGTTFSLEHTGYDSSDEQTTYIALELAVRALDAAVPEKSLVDVPLDAGARDLFVDRFLADAPTFDEPFHWWVREDFVSAAGDAGDAHLLPTLTRWLPRPTDGDASSLRTRIEAINAIATLSGDDRRFDANGKARGVEEVAESYVKKAPKK